MCFCWWIWKGKKQTFSCWRIDYSHMIFSTLMWWTENEASLALYRRYSTKNMSWNIHSAEHQVLITDTYFSGSGVFVWKLCCRSIVQSLPGHIVDKNCQAPRLRFSHKTVTESWKRSPTWHRLYFFQLEHRYSSICPLLAKSQIFFNIPLVLGNANKIRNVWLWHHFKHMSSIPY